MQFSSGSNATKSFNNSSLKSVAIRGLPVGLIEGSSGGCHAVKSPNIERGPGIRQKTSAINTKTTIQSNSSWTAIGTVNLFRNSSYMVFAYEYILEGALLESSEWMNEWIIELINSRTNKWINLVRIESYIAFTIGSHLLSGIVFLVTRLLIFWSSLSWLSTCFGFTDTALHWIQFYLSSRSFSEKTPKTSSQSCPLTCGVPQGSVLGPLLFILYTTPLLLYI